MQFINPVFLFGLFAIGVPIIIHLFNFRRFRKVYFTNVKFIEEINQQTQKQKQVRHLVILLLRMLAIAAIVLAFSQPFLPAPGSLHKKGSSRAISIFLDNSFSMETRSENGTLIDEARQRAKEIVSAYSTSDVFQVFSNDFEGKYQRFVSKDEVSQIIDEIRISPASRSLTEVFARQMELLSNSASTTNIAYVISDFQKSFSDFSQIKNDSSKLVYLIPLKAEKTNNLFIDTCWFNTPVLQKGQNARLITRIKNLSGADLEKIPLKLVINGTQRGLANFNVSPNGSVDVELNFTILENGNHQCYVELTDYPIVIDDRLYFSFQVLDRISVFSIYDDNENSYIKKLYSGDSAFSYNSSNLRNLNYNIFLENDLIFLSGLKEIPTGLASEITRYLQNGGNLSIFPSPEVDLVSYRNLLESFKLPAFTEWDTTRLRCQSINFNSRIFQDVFEKGVNGRETSSPIDLPYVFGYYRLSNSISSVQEVLITLQNGDPFLVAFQFGKGNLYLFVSPPDEEYSTFQRHALFVPVMYRLAFLSNLFSQPYYYLDEHTSIEVSRIVPIGDQILKIKNPERNFEIIPEHRIINSRLTIFPHGQITEAGNFFLYNDNQVVMPISFNNNRSESDLAVVSPNEISKQIKDLNLTNFKVLKVGEKPLNQTINEINKGIHLWKWFIVLALFFLFMEVVLLRIWAK